MELILENTCNTNTLSGNTIYLFLVYSHLKKNPILPLYSFLCANIVFKARSKDLVMLLLRKSHVIFINFKDRDNKSLNKGRFFIFYLFFIYVKYYMQMVFLICFFVVYQISLYGTKFNLNKTFNMHIESQTHS